MKAFPSATGAEGMELRDNFAAKAMQAMVTISCDSADFEEDAIQAYALADEMMKARQQ